ncbi:MAG: chemotaxis protein CheX [Lachnospiraceae bacterium]|nr:chemotaxis protein CheX [Lachnospiraceae bacterium]
MRKTIDVNNINPFLQSTISVFESVTQLKLGVGKPAMATFSFSNPVYTITVGVVGQMKGQAMLAMTVDNAKDIASRMMMGMPVNDLDDMACSALNELSNMIMGNTATMFSTLGKIIDITPPFSTMGNNLRVQSDIDPIAVPLLYDGVEYLKLYICVYEE